MKKLTPEHFTHSEGSRGIGERNTISSGPDDGTNNLLASTFWNPRRHGSTTQAIDNALIAPIISITPNPPPSFVSSGGLNIAGHGNEGHLETGMGQTGPADVNQYVNFYNQRIWGPQLDRLVTTPITLVSIWSCHTGAGQDGADLLYALALRVGRAVRARTGFTFTNGQSTTFENGSVWQVATPDFKPAPIAAPTPHVTTSEIPMFEGTTQAYEFDDLSELKVQQFALGKRILASQTYSDADAVYIGSLLFLGPALEMQASIAGMITGHITLRFSSQEIIEFDVINDRLAVNKTNAVAYYLRSGINSLLQGD